MVQHIGLQREDERGQVVAMFGDEGIPTEVLDLAPSHSACVRFIDPYGDTVFNQLQLPVLIDELAAMLSSSPTDNFRRHLESVLSFLRASAVDCEYVRFIGD